MISIAGVNLVLDWSTFAVFAIVFVAGIIRGFTGFGSALLAVPALAVLVGPAQAVVIEVLIELPVILSLIPTALRNAQRRTVLPMLSMCVVFVPLGALLLAVIDPRVVSVLISVFVLCAVALMAWQTRIASAFSARSTYLVGVASGLTQGLTGMAGPLFATALLARGESAVRTRANISVMAAGIIVLSVASFCAFGLITRDILVLAAAASPAIVLGVWVGSWLFRRGGERVGRGVVLCFLAATAVLTLYRAI